MNSIRRALDHCPMCGLQNSVETHYSLLFHFEQLPQFLVSAALVLIVGKIVEIPLNLALVFAIVGGIGWCLRLRLKWYCEACDVEFSGQDSPPVHK